MERSHGSPEQVWIDLSGGSYFLLRPQSIWHKVNHNSNTHDVVTLNLPANRILGHSKLFCRIYYGGKYQTQLFFFQGKLVDLLSSVTDIAMGISLSLTRPQQRPQGSGKTALKHTHTHTHTRNCLDSVKFHLPSALFHPSGRILQFEFSPHFDSEKVLGSLKQNSCAASLCCCWMMECAGWISRWSCLGAEKPAADSS